MCDERMCAERMCRHLSDGRASHDLTKYLPLNTGAPAPLQRHGSTASRSPVPRDRQQWIASAVAVATAAVRNVGDVAVATVTVGAAMLLLLLQLLFFLLL